MESAHGKTDQVMKQYQHAIEMFLEALELQPSFISANFHVGLMYHKKGDYLKALQCFSKVLEEDELRNDKRVYLARGDVYKDMEYHVKAI